jgi:sugar lactone lactonase YvrE
VTDTANSRVQAFNANGKFLEAFNGKDNNSNNKFITPFGIQFNSNNNGDVLFVADPGQSSTSRTLRQYNGKTSSSKFGKFIENDGTSGLTSPHDIAADNKNRIWVVNMVTPGEVFLFDKDGDFTVKFKPSNELKNPEGIATYTDKNKNVFVYVADTQNNRIVKFRYDSNNSSSGLKFIDAVGSSGSGDKNFNRPTGMTADECGNLFIADRNNARIQVLDNNLKFIDNFSRSFNNPTDVALGPKDDVLYVVDSGNNRIVKFDLS